MKQTLSSHRKLQVWLAIAGVFFMFGVAALAAGILVRADNVNTELRIQRHADYQICVRVNTLNKVIVAQLARSATNTPKLSYYKEHPRELRLILKEIRREQIAFRPRAC